MMERYIVNGINVRKIASTNTRMLSHRDFIENIWNYGMIKPVTFHLAPTDECNLSCDFCSVKDRGGNELTLEQCKMVIDTYAKLGAKSMELTGGGDPLMYPHLIEVIEHAKHRGLAIGLITNGIALNDYELSWTKDLTWMRISLSGIDFDAEDIYLDINSDEIKTYLGCSYVIGKNTTKEKLKQTHDVARHLKSEYVRIVPNCYSTSDIEWARTYAPLQIKDYPEMFLQIKDYNTPPMCYWRYVKPFVNSDGWVYQCSTCSLFTGYFSEHWRVARIEYIKSIYEKGVHSFGTSRCRLCFYTTQNQLLHDLMISKDVVHKEFI